MKDETRQTYEERVRRVLRHLEAQLDEEHSLEELAALGHFSPFHFHRIFHALVGEPVHRYLRRLRLERAAIQLAQTERPVLAIAVAAGYDAQESFTRAFKTMFGLPPARFRSENGKLPPRPSGVGVQTRGERPMEHEVRVESFAPRRVAVLRHVGPYDEVAASFDRLLAWAAPKGLLGPGAEILGLCWDDPAVTAPESLRYDAALVVDDEVEAEGEVGVRDLAGGAYAVLCHEGPYAELDKSYAYLYGSWLPKSGREPAGEPCQECYLNDPESTEPADLLTDIRVLLEP